MQKMIVGGHTILHTQHDALVWLDVKHSGTWSDGYVAGGYGAIVSGHSHWHHAWGFGGVRSTELLYLHGLAHIIRLVIAMGTNDSPSIVVFVPSDGFTRYFELFPKWHARGGMDSRGSRPEAYEDIRYCFHVRQLGRIDIIRVTAGEHHLPEANALAWRAAKLGERKQAELKPVIALTGDDLPSLDAEETV